MVAGYVFVLGGTIVNRPGRVIWRCDGMSYMRIPTMRIK